MFVMNVICKYGADTQEEKQKESMTHNAIFRGIESMVAFDKYIKHGPTQI